MAPVPRFDDGRQEGISLSRYVQHTGKVRLHIAPEGIIKLLHRRQFLHVGAGAAVLAAIPRLARAQTYPVRPVRIMVGFAPGGPADTIARLAGHRLSERLGQQFIVENRTGAGTNIATEAVVNSVPDGYTLLLVTSANFINATLYRKLNFNFMRDTVPVASLSREPAVMLVHPSVPAKTIPEFITYAKANPGKLNMGSGGNGAPSHLFGELFKMSTSTDMVHVPFRGAAPAVTALLGDQVQVFFSPLSTAVEYVKAGKARALAVTTADRSEALADVPTMREFVPGYEASNWYGIAAPRNTPAEVIDKLNREINAVLADPGMRARIADLGETVLGGSPADFAKPIAEETEKWAKVVEFCGAKVD
jgi:tripartite-type tricarboxylate transporter receptor subunit TctC